MIDTHCHLDLVARQKNLEIVINEALQAGVTHFIVPGINQDNWAELIKLGEKHAQIYYAFGFHPLFLGGINDNSIQRLKWQLEESFRLSQKCVAVGECGLDFFQGKEQVDEQISLLEQQILLANQFKLPVILHSRKAHQEMIQSLKRTQPDYGGVVHGFSGSYQQAMDYINLGLKIGVGGVITYPRANKTRQTIARLPLESLVFETDAPDMPLSGYQGVPNEPKRVAEVLTSLNTLRTEQKQTIASQVKENSKLLFGICDL
ncbi:TatD family hydrolase [Vibrio sp. SCSIO 43136]|uniref:TatD family hydrolase n=1 Tax=Vibrio sp. SCSIO 43136 TaxID=2819101 RepID=UPI0020760DD2|nr:TatD family hydrolase [Vibrio sp. SCSIO 43136]USD64756.1 TatD family hydrolase [Vibrio sp. SCSIO 43136]